VQKQAIRAYALWRKNPGHPGLQFVSEKHAVFSVRVGIHWRTLGYRGTERGEDVFTWFWIGSHADYDNLIASL
jgi:hypothetical protein